MAGGLFSDELITSLAFIHTTHHLSLTSHPHVHTTPSLYISVYIPLLNTHSPPLIHITLHTHHPSLLHQPSHLPTLTPTTPHTHHSSHSPPLTLTPPFTPTLLLTQPHPSHPHNPIHSPCHPAPRNTSSSTQSLQVHLPQQYNGRNSSQHTHTNPSLA